MKKLIVSIALVCFGMISYSEENGCGPTDSNTNKTKQTTPAKDTEKAKEVKKGKKVKKQVQKKDDKNSKDANKTSGTCKIK